MFHNAIRKYGAGAFEVVTLETIVGTFLDIAAAERRYIYEHQCKVPTGYNVLDGGGNANDFSDSTRKERHTRGIEKRSADPKWQEANALKLRRAWDASKAKFEAKVQGLSPEEAQIRRDRREVYRRYRLRKKAERQGLHGPARFTPKDPEYKARLRQGIKRRDLDPKMFKKRSAGQRKRFRKGSVAA